MLVPKLRFKREDGTDYREWEEKTLQDVSSYITTTGTGEKSVYVGTENMRKDCSGVVLEDNNDTTVKGIQYALNDVLVSNIRPYLKKAWRADRSGICSTDVLCIRGTSGILSEYLYTLLSSDSFFEYVMQGVKGTKMPRGDKKHIMDMPVSIPCLEEQQKIADFLTAVDEVIAQSEAEVQNLEQQKKAAMQKIFSQEVRFKREDGTEYPEWEENTVLNVLGKVSSGKTKPDNSGSFPLYGSMGVIGTCLSANYKGKKLLIARVGANAGTINYVEEDCGVTDNTLVICNEVENLKYFYYALQECNLGKMVIGSGQPLITGSGVQNVVLLLPCLEEQQKIADFLSAYDEAIRYAKQELDKWKELKKGLLQQMFV